MRSPPVDLIPVKPDFKQRYGLITTVGPGPKCFQVLRGWSGSGNANSRKARVSAVQSCLSLLPLCHTIRSEGKAVPPLSQPGRPAGLPGFRLSWANHRECYWMANQHAGSSALPPGSLSRTLCLTWRGVGPSACCEGEWARAAVRRPPRRGRRARATVEGRCAKAAVRGPHCTAGVWELCHGCEVQRGLCFLMLLTRWNSHRYISAYSRPCLDTHEHRGRGGQLGDSLGPSGVMKVLRCSLAWCFTCAGVGLWKPRLALVCVLSSTARNRKHGWMWAEGH